MQWLIRWIPASLGALAAFVALKLANWLGVESLAYELVCYFLAFAIVGIATERAMRAYAELARQPGHGSF